MRRRTGRQASGRLGCPHFQCRPFRNAAKVGVGRKHREIVPDAQLREECVDRSDLNPGASTVVSELGCFDMVATIRDDERQGQESFENFVFGLWPGKTLQQLLENKSSREDGLIAFDGAGKSADLGGRGSGVAPESKRPYAGINEEAQRERSFL